MTNYSAYSASLYNYTPKSLGLNSIAQSGYSDFSSNFQNGKPFAAGCPQGTISDYLNQIPLSSSSTPVTGNDLSNVMKKAYFDTQQQNPVGAFNLQCAPNPVPCEEVI